MTDEIATAPSAGARRILRRAEVEQRTGFKRAHLYSLMRAGKFPRALRLGIRAVGWDSTEVDAWIAERLKDRTTGAQAISKPSGEPLHESPLDRLDQRRRRQDDDCRKPRRLRRRRRTPGPSRRS